MEQRRLIEFRMPMTGELLSFSSKQYYISEDGQVWNDGLKRYLKQHEIRGYNNVALLDNNGKWHVSVMVHNLVASVYIRLLNKGENVHHKNHDPKDNRLENLEIIDANEHVRQHDYEKWRNGAMDGVGKKVSEKLRNVGTSRPAKQVAQIDINGRLVKVWPSTHEAGRNGYNFGHISACCLGKQKTHKGFRWMWYEDFQKQKEEAQQLELSFSE